MSVLLGAQLSATGDDLKIPGAIIYIAENDGKEELTSSLDNVVST